MRVAVLGAFPYPYPQGSQIYVTDHSRALKAAGMEPVLFTYGRGIGEPPDDLAIEPSPRWLSPAGMRSGPSWQKFPGDAALCSTYLAAHRREPFDVALAHNAEAAMVALAGRRLSGVPVVYVVHTVLRYELSSYGSPGWAPYLDPIGRRIDEFVARHADGILCLSEDARELLAPVARGPMRVIPPGLDPAPDPAPNEIDAACAKHALARDRFVLYTGNLDGYQDLELLAGAAKRLAREGEGTQGGAHEIVVATHDRGRSEQLFRDAPNLRCIEVADFDEMRALLFAAQSLVLTRRRRGGFPIKLLNYMEARRPIVAFERIAPGFEHGKNAWLLPLEAGAAELADGLAVVARDRELATHLGQGARALLEERHGWAGLGGETAEVIREVVGERAAGR